MIPMMKERFVKKLGWIDQEELMELTALGQSAPGAMVINSAALMGYRLLGFRGAVSAVLGTALPAVIVLAAVSVFYELIRNNTYVSAAFRGMRAGVAAVIADTVVSMAVPYFRKDTIISAVIMAGAFLIAFVFSINVAFVIIGCGALGILLGVIRRKRGKSL